MEDWGTQALLRHGGRQAHVAAISSDPAVLCKHAQLSAPGAAQAGGGTPVHLSNVMLFPKLWKCRL